MSDHFPRNRLEQLVSGHDPEAHLRDVAVNLRREMARTLGEKRARDLWAEVGKVPRGKPPGEVMYRDESLILALYDAIENDKDFKIYGRGRIVREMAMYFHEKEPGQHGNSEMAIAKRVGRILKRRDAAPSGRAAALAQALLAYPTRKISDEGKVDDESGQ